jgi:hypothetical protein
MESLRRVKLTMIYAMVGVSPPDLLMLILDAAGLGMIQEDSHKLYCCMCSLNCVQFQNGIHFAKLHFNIDWKNMVLST